MAGLFDALQQPGGETSEGGFGGQGFNPILGILGMILQGAGAAMGGGTPNFSGIGQVMAANREQQLQNERLRKRQQLVMAYADKIETSNPDAAELMRAGLLQPEDFIKTEEENKKFRMEKEYASKAEEEKWQRERQAKREDTLWQQQNSPESQFYHTLFPDSGGGAVAQPQIAGAGSSPASGAGAVQPAGYQPDSLGAIEQGVQYGGGNQPQPQQVAAQPGPPQADMKTRLEQATGLTDLTPTEITWLQLGASGGRDGFMSAVQQLRTQREKAKPGFREPTAEERQRFPGVMYMTDEGPKFGPSNTTTSIDPETGKVTITQGSGGATGAALPAEVGGRIGLGQKWLEEDYAELERAISAGEATGPIDQAAANLGYGKPAQIRRRIQTGLDALRRSLTGAGMSEGEAAQYASRYEPQLADTAETALQKLRGLRQDLEASMSGSIAAKTGALTKQPSADTAQPPPAGPGSSFQTPEQPINEPVPAGAQEGDVFEDSDTKRKFVVRGGKLYEVK